MGLGWVGWVELGWVGLRWAGLGCAIRGARCAVRMGWRVGCTRRTCAANTPEPLQIMQAMFEKSDTPGE